MMETTIARQLMEDGYVLTHSMGVSMQPMLTQQTEQLLIERLTVQPGKNDVVLYRRGSGQYVLHRILRFDGQHYLIRGDNCYGKPEKVAPRQIIGILKGFYRGETYIDCGKSRMYRVYVLLWRLSYPFRMTAYWCLGLFRRAISFLRR